MNRNLHKEEVIIIESPKPLSQIYHESWLYRQGLEPLLVGLVVVGSGALRLYNLTRNSLWFDETYHLTIARQTSFLDTFTIYSKFDVHPPLFYPVMHLWMKLVGMGEAPVRLLSVIAALVTMLVVYLIARRYLGYKIALTGLLLLSVSPLLLFWSQSIRPYAWFTMLVAISMGLALFASEKPEQNWRWLPYIVSAAILPYTHYLGLHVIFCQAVFLLFILYKRPPALLRLGVSLALIGLAFLPWLGKFLEQAKNGPAFYTNNGPKQLLEALTDFSSAFVPDSYLLLVGAFFLPLYALGMVHLWQKQPKIAVFLASWGFLPVITVWLSSLIRPNFAVRYFVFCVPAYLLVIAVGGWKLYSFWKIGAALALVAVLCLNLGSIVNYNRSYYYQDWRGMVNYIVDHRQPNDLIFLANPWGYTKGPFDYYYAYQLNSPGNMQFQTVTDQAQVKPQVASMFQTHQRVWMVSVYDGYKDWITNSVFPSIPPGFKVSYRQKYNNPEQGILELVLFERLAS
jgi:uncharacterized membrane protein